MSVSQPPPRRSLLRRLWQWLTGSRSDDSSLVTSGLPAEVGHPEVGPPTEQEVKVDTVRLSNVEEVQRAGRVVDRQLEAEFQRRIAEPVRATRLELSGVNFFANAAWNLDPHVNVLLGRNGYGKSLILRILVGMLQRAENATSDVFVKVGPSARIKVALNRNGCGEAIERDHQVFLDGSAGKVPVLAIPDSRFTDRSTMVLADPSGQNLAFDGATQFLERAAYQATVDGLLAGLAVDYWLSDNRFDIPSFSLLRRVVGELTNDEFDFDSVQRVGRTGSVIKVRTDGLDRPLPIKDASQGTLSVIAMFGLIHAFLQDVASAGGLPGDGPSPRAIVIIDEVDAHLHPSWQQRIRHLLTTTFPTVQFILSSHSPLVVAGCGRRQVAVLRKAGEQGGFVIDEVSDDLIGAVSHDLYSDLFDIEDRDGEFRRYANMADRGEDRRIREQIDALYSKQEEDELKAAEAVELSRLVDEVNKIGRVTKVRENEREAEREVLDLEVQVARLQRRVSELESELHGWTSRHD